MFRFEKKNPIADFFFFIKILYIWWENIQSSKKIMYVSSVQ